MLSLVLSLAISQTAVGPPAEPVDGLVAARMNPRLRLGFHVTGGAGAGGGTSSQGVGLMGEIGVVLRDQFSLTFRNSGMALPGFGLMVMALVGLDYSLSDKFTVGGGGGAMFLIAPTNSSMSIVLPFRVTFAPFSREPEAVARRGLLVSLEAGPAYGFRTYAGRGSPAPMPITLFGFSAQLSVGFAWW